MTGRASFASQGIAPVQTNSTYQGASQGSQVVGGNAQGEAVMVGPQTQPGSVGGELGEYFGKLMQPYLERKQQTAMFNGIQAAQSGIALKELSHPNNPLTKIFGPTGFERGAQFYTAQTAVSGWNAAMLDNKEELIAMSPEQVSEHLAKTSQSVMTGDPFADQIIQQGILEATNPLMNTIAKARFAKGQTDVVAAQFIASKSSATALQSLAYTQSKAGRGQPDEAGMDAIAQAAKTFVGGLGQPHGQTDDSHRRFIMDTYNDAMHSGNGYAVQAMRAAGMVEKLGLSPDEVDKLDSAYDRAGTKANMAELDKRSDDLILHDFRLLHDGAFTPIEAADDWRRITNEVQAATGFDTRMPQLDPVSTAKTVTQRLVEIKHHNDEIARQRAERLQDRAMDKQDELDREARKVNLATSIARSGNPVQGILAGAEPDLIDATYSKDWQEGNLKDIMRVYKNYDGYVSSAVQKLAKGSVEATAGTQYTKAFEKVHQQWSALNAQSPAAALSYYGPYHAMMQQFDQLARSTDAVSAYSQAFGDVAQYGSADVGPERRAELNKSIDGMISAQRHSIPVFGRTNLGSHGEAVLKQVIWAQVATAGRNTPQGTKAIGDAAAEAALKDGRYERYGQFAWRNAVGTMPLGTMLGLQQRDADAVFRSYYNKQMASHGADADADPSSMVRYDNNGHPAIIAHVPGRNGHDVVVTMLYSDLAKEAHDYVSSKVARGNPSVSRKDFKGDAIGTARHNAFTPTAEQEARWNRR